MGGSGVLMYMGFPIFFKFVRYCPYIVYILVALLYH